MIYSQSGIIVSKNWYFNLFASHMVFSSLRALGERYGAAEKLFLLFFQNEIDSLTKKIRAYWTFYDFLFKSCSLFSLKNGVTNCVFYTFLGHFSTDLYVIFCPKTGQNINFKHSPNLQKIFVEDKWDHFGIQNGIFPMVRILYVFNELKKMSWYTYTSFADLMECRSSG